MPIFKAPGKIIFQLNALNSIGDYAGELGASKALIVTGRILADIGFVRSAILSLKEKGIHIDFYSEIEPEPNIKTAEKVSNLVREERYELVIGIGGGSILDIAKVASVMATNPGNIREYFGFNLIKNRGIPKILIPTTAGTGSEVSNIAVLNVDGGKEVIYSDYLFADIAIVDPILTVTMPPELTAYTGLDAFSHALEAYMSLDSWPLTDALALKSIYLIMKNLPEAYRDGENIEARSNMSLAATLAGLAFTNAGVCLGHALGLVLSSKYKLPHGLSVGISLYYALLYNLPNIENKLIDAAEAFGIEKHKAKREKVVLMIVKQFEKLLALVGISPRLSNFGIKDSDIPEIVKETLKIKRHIKRNPRHVSKEELEYIIMTNL